MHKLFLATALLPEGWRDDVLVTIDDGRIVTVELAPDSAALAGAERVSGIALPGVANLHSHTFQRGFAGLTERRGDAEDHFWTWREAMYRFVGLLSPDDVEAIAAQAFVEMLESGFSAVAEFHYLHHQPDGRPYGDPAELAARIAAAAAATGIGLTLLPVFYAHGGFGDRPPSASQRRFVSTLDGYARLVEASRRAVAGLPGARVGLAPHSLRAANAAEIAALLDAAPDGPVHIHVAEQEREVEECMAATGARPVDWLLDHAGVDERWCLIHATHMTEGETGRLARTGAVAGLCPITESNLGDGIFPAVDFLAAGGRFGVGSDSNVLIDLPGELRTLEYSQRLRDRARNRLGDPGRSTGRRLFEDAARGGAQAAGRGEAAIAAGCPADIVVLDRDAVALHGRNGDSVLDSWIFGATRPVIDAVHVAGRPVVRQGHHVDRTSIAARFKRTVDRLARAM